MLFYSSLLVYHKRHTFPAFYLVMIVNTAGTHLWFRKEHNITILEN